MKVTHMLSIADAKKYWAAVMKYTATGEYDQPAGTYDGWQIVTTKRASTCRACGRLIPAGQDCLEFGIDFVGSGSFTATMCRIHLSPCIRESVV